MRTNLSRNISVFLIALLGGFLGSALHSSSPVEAAGHLYQWVSGISVSGFDGRQRLQLATYNAPGEKGLPLVGLTDNKDHLRLLLRLGGPNESPVIVIKDSKGQDRLVMGLDMSGPNEEPFLATIDSQGQKHLIFGAY